ncbi:MAG: hypothetical protein ABR562_07500, partial [Thermoplasmatota archaeon]
MIGIGPLAAYMGWRAKGWPVREPGPPWPWHATGIAALGAVAAAALLFQGNAQIDHLAPHVAQSRGMFLAALAVGG